MSRRPLVFLVVVVTFVLVSSRLLLQRRSTLRLSHAVAESVKQRDLGEPNPRLAAWAAGQPVNLLGCAKSPEVCGRFRELVGTMAAGHDGRLPDGLEAGTDGALDWRTADSWLNAASVVFAEGSQVDPALCLDTLTFSAFLARHGGADGERIGSRLALLALPECARARPPPARAETASQSRAWLADAMGPMLSGFALDGQLRRFGSWLTAEDLAALPGGMRALAARAPPPPLNPLERNARAAMWRRAADEQQRFAAGAFEISAAVQQWPERVSDPKRLQQAYDEERLRRSAVELVLDAWNLKPGCEPGSGTTSTVKWDGEDCVLTNQNLHVQLPSRKE